jgi:HEXXH motif-containing protein
MVGASFIPDRVRAKEMDCRMRQLLSDSLQHIIDQVEGQLDYDKGQLHNLIRDLSDGVRFPPSTFGHYADLVLAIQREDYEHAIAKFSLLANEKPITSSPWQLIALDDRRDAERTELYRHYIDTDPVTPFAILPPPEATAVAFAERLQVNFKFIRDTMPDLAGEIEHLVSQIILVSGDPDSHYQFDGGSSYMLWGGLFLNVTSHETDVAMVEVLAHESAHLLLFGYSRDEPLVLNPDEDVYPSPLRTDLRPMDGIYHSTYVSARMHWAMSQLLESGRLDEDGSREAQVAREADRKNFYDGHAVVAQSAILTETGKAVMDGARAYMDCAS